MVLGGLNDASPRCRHGSEISVPSRNRKDLDGPVCSFSESLNRRLNVAGHGVFSGNRGEPKCPMTRIAQRTRRIVGGYLRHNPVAADQLPSVISTVHQALIGLGKPAEPVQTELSPAAVPIRRSVQQEFVVCLECGWRGLMLRGHLRARHNFSPEQYRARWKLPRDHALVAPAYSERRSGLAKQIGLGRLGRGASGKASGLAAPGSQRAAQPRRRGRPRSAPATL